MSQVKPLPSRVMIIHQIKNPVTVNSVEDSSPIKLQSNGMIGHREDNAQSAQQLSSEWPFAKSSPCVQQSLSQENCDGTLL